MQKEASKKNWLITPNAFRRLLEWLDEGESSDGQNYLKMRQRLVDYFDRKSCLLPDELADRTLNRVARRLEEEGQIESETPAKYCYITARFIFLENLREADKANISLSDVKREPPANPVTDTAKEEREIKEKMLDCLEQCTAKLDPANRDLIVNYYFGAERIKIENRRTLAQKLDISMNALSIRACRIRDKLEVCVKQCAGN